MRNNKIKIVVDTNVFVNSMIFPESHIDDTKTFAILVDLIRKNEVELVFSQDTVGEFIYILKNKTVHHICDENQINYMTQALILFFYSYSVNTEDTIAPKCNDPRDDMFLKCAVQSRAKYLISNDLKSGMHLVNIRTKILGTKEFVNEIENKKEIAQDANKEDNDDLRDVK